MSSKVLQVQWADVCEVCRDLDVFDLSISPGALLMSAENGGRACSILQKGINSVQESVCDVETLELVIDYSLYVVAMGKDKTRLATVEFYTHDGKALLLFPYILCLCWIVQPCSFSSWPGAS
jgi:hypothetical protein